MVLVLASASPRRQQLLRNARIAFTVQPADVPELFHPGESPNAVAERLARAKAEAVAGYFPSQPVLGADTVVVVDEEILGKPADRADAERMLRLLSGKTHQVITGVCLAKMVSQAALPMKASDKSFEFMHVRSELTRVTMSTPGDQELEAYLSTSEPMDKAGGYAIQGMASRWIPRIEGDYSNVVGLPVSLVCRMLRDHGIAY